MFCGPSVVFTNVMNPQERDRTEVGVPADLVRQGATLGANCTIVCGHTVGRYAFVAAGAVVTGDVPDHALVMGVPAESRSVGCAPAGSGFPIRRAARRPARRAEGRSASSPGQLVEVTT